ncbi:MAG: hypothetical protein RBR98_02430 [Candidatus Moranbacteria bacterium]|jgi:hypothetical protein|nr:hypothetical protein [Candidatus Moranbacteria bacterium]
MPFDLKKRLKNSLNAYFLFVALAFTIGAYVFLLDNSVKYVAEVDVLVTAKSEKTALNFEKIRQNIVVLAEKADILEGKAEIEINSKDSFIGFRIEEATQTRALEKSDILIRAFIDNTGKYYDGQNELGLEVVNKEVSKKETGYFWLLVKSLIIGLILSFIVQLILDLIERAFLVSMKRKENLKKEYPAGRKDLENVFRFNSEKIRKLSSDFETINTGQPNLRRNVDFYPETEKNDIQIRETQAPEPIFKKAASPINLPIASQDNWQEAEPLEEERNFLTEESLRDLEARAFGNIVHSDHQDEVEQQPLRENVLKGEGIVSGDISEAEKPVKEFVEPTEEDFKKKLNQLLGNR